MQRNAKRVCQLCEKSFYGSGDCYYCPSCAKEKKADTVVRIRICKDCGIEFFGGPRAGRCPACAYKAQQAANKLHKKNGTKRPLGSVDKCIICGKEYIVVAGRQKYCSDACQRTGVLEWQREHKKEYNKRTGQNIRKQEMRRKTQKICVYCLQTFTSKYSSNVCSDYCRGEQRKLLQCMADINRGHKRNLKQYEDKRELYRERCKSDR